MKRKRIAEGDMVMVNGKEGVVTYTAGDLCSVLDLRRFSVDHHRKDDLTRSVWRDSIAVGTQLRFYTRGVWFRSHAVAVEGNQVSVQPWGCRRRWTVSRFSTSLLRDAGDPLPQPFAVVPEPHIYARAHVTHPVEMGVLVDTCAGGYIFRGLGFDFRFVTNDQIVGTIPLERGPRRLLGTVCRNVRNAERIWRALGHEDAAMLRFFGQSQLFDLTNPGVRWYVPRTEALLHRMLTSLINSMDPESPGAREMMLAYEHLPLYAPAHALETAERERNLLAFEVDRVEGDEVVLRVYSQSDGDSVAMPDHQIYYFPLLMEILGASYPAAKKPWRPEPREPTPRLLGFQRSVLDEVQRRERTVLSMSHRLGSDFDPFMGFSHNYGNTYGGVLCMPSYGKTRIMVCNFDASKTLVLCRHSAIDHWKDEMGHCSVSWGCYYGAQHDVDQTVIISTYKTWRGSEELRGQSFRRIVMDDAHTIPFKSVLFSMLIRNRTPIRWCLVRESTLYVLLLNLLRVAPFYDRTFTYACSRVEQHVEALCANRIFITVKSSQITEVRPVRVHTRRIVSHVTNQRLVQYFRQINPRCTVPVYHPREAAMEAWALPSQETTPQLARRSVKFTGDLDSLAGGTAICAICQDNVTSPTILSCGHIFCHLCLQEAKAHSTKCPNCRTKFKHEHRLVDRVDSSLKLLVSNGVTMCVPRWVHALLDEEITNRLALVDQILGQTKGQIIVYTRSAHMARTIGQRPGNDYITTQQGTKTRRKALRDFRENKFRVLAIASNVRLTGVSLAHVSQVVNVLGQKSNILSRMKVLGQKPSIQLYDIL